MLTICKPTRSFPIESAGRDYQAYTTRNDSAGQKRGPGNLGGGTRGLRTMGEAIKHPPTHSDYACPIGRARAGRAFGRPRAVGVRLTAPPYVRARTLLANAVRICSAMFGTRKYGFESHRFVGVALWPCR
jgi:hypothetical protein